MSTEESPIDRYPIGLLQRIFRHQPRSIQLTLSLVSKKWREASQDEIFSTLNMNSAKAVQKWLNAPENDESRDPMFRCVRTLSCKIPPFGIDPKLYPRFFGEYLHRFSSLTSLHLENAHFDEGTCQAIWDNQQNIKVLTLMCCGFGTIDHFVTLVRKFPNLTHLRLSELRLINNASPETSFPFPPSLKNLFATKLFPEHKPLLDVIRQAEWDDVSISAGIESLVKPTQHVIGGLSGSVKCLDLQGDPAISGPGLGLSRFKVLRELRICGESPGSGHAELISTIKSPDIQKIIISRSPALIQPGNYPYWVGLDNALSRLVQREEYKGRLVVEIQVVSWRRLWGVQQPTEAEYLPKFRSEHPKSLVKFVD